MDCVPSCSYGRGCPGINELKPPTVRFSYGERWTKNKIDLLELVTLRESGWTLRAIAAKVGIGHTEVLRRLKAQGCAYGNFAKSGNAEPSF